MSVGVLPRTIYTSTAIALRGALVQYAGYDRFHSIIRPNRSTNMSIDKSLNKTLRGRAHDLQPVVRIGQGGLTENVLLEIERALGDHELIKISVKLADKAARDAALDTICKESGADRVDRIGNIAVLYRPRPEQKS